MHASMLNCLSCARCDELPQCVTCMNASHGPIVGDLVIALSSSDHNKGM